MVKINIATAIAAAFGFVIALIWKEIIVGLFTGIIITIVCVFDIMYISKWGGIGKKKLFFALFTFFSNLILLNLYEF